MVLALLAVVLIGEGCVSPPPFFRQAEQYRAAFAQPKRRFTYVLQFDANGRLVNFNTLFQAVNEIQQSATASATNNGGPVTNILVLSYGWNYDNTVIEDHYDGLLSNYDAYIQSASSLGPERSVGPTAVICLSWPASYPTVVQLLSDFLPGTSTTRTIVLDIFFPLSFWAKTSLADRVGYGDVQQALGYLCGQSYHGDFQPNIYMVGHSFGCRVIASAMREKPPSNKFAFGSIFNLFTSKELSSEATNDIAQFQSRIRGAVLIEPAMAKANLPGPKDCANFPVLVTQSRYDHVNSLLYPITALFFNGYWSAELDARFARSVYRKTINEANAKWATHKWLVMLRPPLLETLRVPFSVLDSLEIFPWSYLRGQWWELGPGHWSWRTNLLTSTLAQVPIVKIPVQLTLNSGYNKGIFDAGYYHESAARITFDRESALNPINTVDSTNYPTALTLRPGVQFVDADELISRPSHKLKLDYQNPWWNFTVGQLDPIGSHNDYQPNVGHYGHPEIYDWIHFFLHDSVVGGAKIRP